MKNKYKILIIILAVLHTYSCASTPSYTPEKPLLDIQIDELSKQFIDTLSSKNKSTLAIMDFVELDGSQSMFGKYLREELTIRIFRTNKVSVVERGMLEQVMEEWDFGANGYVSEQTASRIGQLLGVEAITIGTITDLGENLKVNARIIEVETGKLISVASAYITKDSTVLALLDNKEKVIKEETEIIPDKKDVIEDKIIIEEKVPEVKKDINHKITFEEQGIKFNIDKAEFSKSKNSLILTGSVTSQQTDKIFRYYPSYLQLIINNGNTYYANSMDVGLTHAAGYGKSVDLIEGIDTSMQIIIDDFQSIPTHILRLQVSNYWDAKNIGDIKFSIKPNMKIELIN